MLNKNEGGLKRNRQAELFFNTMIDFILRVGKYLAHHHYKPNISLVNIKTLNEFQKASLLVSIVQIVVFHLAIEESFHK